LKKYFLILALLTGSVIPAQTDTTPPEPPPPSLLSRQLLDSARVYSFAEEMPSYPGGEQAYVKYLSERTNYPPAEKKAGHQGVVYVSFVVERDGSISDVHAVKEVAGAPGLTQEAIRVISAMPNWIPGTMQGRPVRVTIVQPIRFQLTDPPPRSVCGKDTLKGPVTYITPDIRKPLYPGSDTALQNYFIAHDEVMRAFEYRTNGKSMTISFIIDSVGNVHDVKVEQPVPGEEELSVEIAKVFCSMPGWLPGGKGKRGGKKSTDLNVKMYAVLYLGIYKNGVMEQKPSIVLKDKLNP
jgi:TonB family protein